ncbi:MAG: hypothetical protein HY694_08995 [Deltaproteobacteria bacterium]|nr:hypothetical protein [Deltaproteobacteria bacterium]
MRFEGRRRAQLLNRCWSIYLWLTQAFILPENFHVEFPATAESALITGALHVTVPMTERLTLSLREEYAFGRQRLEVSRYSYNVIDRNGNNVLRADNLPYHRTDYRGRALTHPPHHLHDERGRVRSFSGQVQDFISYAKSCLTPS